MVKTGLSFKDALSQAQSKGYAERDPSADVDGRDACRKICILGSLAFGRHLYPRQVPTEGISHISLSDVFNADKAGFVVKLLGRARRMADGRICAFVAPHLVEKGSPLAGVEDVFNGIMVHGDVIGDVMFYGRGAGQMPTASAVVADVIDAAKHVHARKYLFWEEGGDIVSPPEALPSRWYVRARSDLAEAGELFGTVRLLTGPENTAGEIAFITGSLGGGAFKSTATKLGQRMLCAMRIL
jgi:homoserine dehydrogenase